MPPRPRSGSLRARRVAFTAASLAVPLACQGKSETGRAVKAEPAEAEPTERPEPPAYGSHPGGDFITRHYANSIGEVPDLPRLEFTEYYPETRPLTIIDTWTNDTCSGTATGEPIACVVHCNSSFWANQDMKDFDALMRAASARGFERAESQNKVDFLDIEYAAGKPLVILRLAESSPSEGVESTIEVKQCRSHAVSVALRDLGVVMAADWRFAPIQSLTSVLDVQFVELSYGRRGEQAFTSCSFVVETPSDALAGWIDKHGLAKLTPDEGYYTTGDGYELRLALAGWKGGTMAVLWVTTAWPE